MSMTDPIADMLVRIKNALAVGKPTVKMPSSKIKQAIAGVLKSEGYIADSHVSPTGPGKSQLEIVLKYYEGRPVIERLEQKEDELAERERDATVMIDDARARIAAIVKREHTVREREREVEKASRQEARKYVLEARAEIDRTIKALTKKGSEAAAVVMYEMGG